ncbi:MAG TPA: hypothetical protein VFF14_01370 [Candidatus Deferrimicrobium sp.]|nr:hypothetical protein [Candidatus Deferrimicrobium sp.]
MFKAQTTPTKWVLPGAETLETWPEILYSDPDRDSIELDTYIVGVWKPDFCDQDYMRARDLQVKARDAEEAIAKYIQKKHNHDQWLAVNEFSLVKVLAILADTCPRCGCVVQQKGWCKECQVELAYENR